LMALLREPDRRDDSIEVEEVELEALAEPRASELQQYEWGREPEVLRQLQHAKRLLAEVVETHFFAVLEGGRPVSWAELYLAGRTAQIEDVGTLESRRGRGYARAVVLRAADAAARAGADLTFLVADDEDWPKELYRKLGFDELGRVFEFLLPKQV
jgi:GNAT superfamily N-acetyltransferase